MAEERRRDNWWYAAWISAEIRNLFASKRVSPKECHPMEAGNSERDIVVPGSELEKFFNERSE